MKKIISIAALMLSLPIGYASAEISNVNVEGGKTDRIFDAERTLYYVEQTTSEIPEITAEGATVIKSATALDTEDIRDRVTVLKDDETGREYRFVIWAKTKQAEIKSFRISETGVLNVEYSSADAEYLNLMILKPVSDSAEESFDVSDVDGTDDLSKVYDIIKIDGNEGTYTCQLPETALCGMYKAVLGGDGILEKASETTYYISNTKLASVLEELNDLSASEDAVDSFIRKYALMINVDKDGYNKISDRTLFVKFLTGQEFSNLDEVLKNYNTAMILSKVNASDADEVVELIMKNKDVFGIDTSVIEEIDDISAVAKLIKNGKYEDAKTLKTAFDKAVAVSYINESEPSEIEKRFEKVFDTLVDDEIVKKNYRNSKNKTGILKELLNKNFATPERIMEELIKAINKDKPSSSQGGSGSGGGGGSSMPYIPAVNSDTMKPEPEEEKVISVNEERYNDIEDVEWAREAIMLLSDRKIVNGKSDKKFAPNDFVTREEFVKMLVLALGLESNNSQISFADVTENDWCYQYILVGVGNKVVTGKSEEIFGVGEKITREDMAVMTMRAINAAKITVNDVITNLYYELDFADTEEISDYAKDSVKTLVKKGIVAGVGDNKYAPKSNATRAQAVQMIYKVIKDI